MSSNKQLQVIKSVLQFNNTQPQEVSMSKKDEIATWYKENGHLLDDLIVESEDIGTRESILIKEWYYNIEGINTGKRIAPRYSEYEEAASVSYTDYVKDEYVMGTYYDHNGRERKFYDDGGPLGKAQRSHMASISTGNISEVTRSSLFELGLDHGQIHVTDEYGNTVGFMTTAEEAEHNRRVEAQTRADMDYLDNRYAKRRELELEMRDYARSVYALIYRKVAKQLDDYSDIKSLIYRAQRLVLKALKREYPEKITRKGGIFIYGPFKYGKTVGQLTNMNVLFHKVECSKLWKAVDESKWKRSRSIKLEKAKAAYRRFTVSISITDNPVEQADLVSSTRVGLSKDDANLVLMHARSKTNKDYLPYAVHQAVMSVAA